MSARGPEAAREIMLLCAFGEARAAAAAAGIKVAALKGTALLERGLYLPGERGMTDADVLVRPGELGAFEKVLSALGYSPMPHSADAWVRPGRGQAPPEIIDVHTGLLHAGDPESLFRDGLEDGPGGAALNAADLFLHAAAHPLLHHGELTARALEDCSRIARAAGAGFWELVAHKAGEYGLRPAVWPAVKRLPGVPPGALDSLRPRGAEKIKAALFERAAARHSDFLEYLLPALHRPGLLLKLVFPGRRFMERRYGSASAGAHVLRPLRLLLSALGRR